MFVESHKDQYMFQVNNEYIQMDTPTDLRYNLRLHKYMLRLPTLVVKYSQMIGGQ